MWWRSLSAYFANVNALLMAEKVPIKIPIQKQDLSPIADFLESEDRIRQLEYEVRYDDYLRNIEKLPSLQLPALDD
jgi:hypothetical protein